MTPLFSESADPLAFHFLAEHQRRYERIKAWRAAQRNPYFTEVTPQWRQEFERKQKLGYNVRQNAGGSENAGVPAK